MPPVKKMIRIEEADDSTGLQTAILHDVVDNAAAQNAKEYYLHGFTLNDAGAIEVSGTTNWRARGIMTGDEAAQQYALKSLGKMIPLQDAVRFLLGALVMTRATSAPMVPPPGFWPK